MPHETSEHEMDNDLKDRVQELVKLLMVRLNGRTRTLGEMPLFEAGHFKDVRSIIDELFSA